MADTKESFEVWLSRIENTILEESKIVESFSTSAVKDDENTREVDAWLQRIDSALKNEKADASSVLDLSQSSHEVSQQMQDLSFQDRLASTSLYSQENCSFSRLLESSSGSPKHLQFESNILEKLLSIRTGFQEQGTASRKQEAVRPTSTSPFRPRINKQSEVLASRMGEPKDRLLQIKPMQKAEEENYSFKPNINQNSAALDSRRIHTTRWKELYALDKERRNRQEQKRVEKKAIEEVSTTQKVVASRSAASQDELVSRLVNWQHRRDLKRKQEADMKRDKSLENCSFTPEIIGTVQFAPGSLREKKGVDQFLDRQRAARKGKEEVEVKETKEVRPKQEEMSKEDYFEAMRALHAELHSIELNL
mmetsp:Transcript_31309/g.54361  ORF Transcript_31309/g.54361 Transcript_31309/m.54361 type:complete len:365 (+) Transcript_31309:2159-3253(+)